MSRIFKYWQTVKAFGKITVQLNLSDGHGVGLAGTELAYDLQVLGSIPATSPFFLDNVPF